MAGTPTSPTIPSERNRRGGQAPQSKRVAINAVGLSICQEASPPFEAFLGTTGELRTPFEAFPATMGRQLRVTGEEVLGSGGAAERDSGPSSRDYFAIESADLRPRASSSASTLGSRPRKLR